MTKNNSLLKDAVGLITYKKKPQKKEFNLTETNEEKNSGSQGQTPSSTTNEENTAKENKDNSKIPNNIDDNELKIQKIFNFPQNEEITIRRFTAMGTHKAFIVYLGGMVDSTIINNSILQPLMKGKDTENKNNCQLDYVINNILETNQAKKITAFDEVTNEILSGNSGIYIDGCDFYVFCETKGYEKRAIDKPQAEGIVKGSQEGFTECIETNITLLRRILKNSDFIVETINVGKRNKNLCAVAYIKDIANPSLINEVKRRLNGISTDYIGSSGMLEQFIEDRPMSLVPTILSTERPDRSAAYIIEGRVAILSDGAPFALIVPVTIATLLQSPEDMFLRWQYGTLLRLIRIFALFSATLFPALYVAVTNYHQEMLPTELLIAIAKARENVPFPTIIEVLLMELSFELIREAGIRIPGIIGNTIGIIGALTIGQAAVQANIVSPVLIIVIAVTGLGNFALPDYSFALGIRLIRIIFIFSGALLGFYGISLLFVALGILFVDYKSFGIPFLAPSAPKVRRSYDTVIRYPVWKQEKNFDVNNPSNVKKQPRVSRQWDAEQPANTQGGEDKNDQGR